MVSFILHSGKMPSFLHFFVAPLMSTTARAFRGHIVSRNRRLRAACCGLRFVLFPQESLTSATIN
jgi:hypothetical protein